MTANEEPAASRLRRFRTVLRDALSGVQHDYTSGSLPRAITLLAIPMVLELAMESVFAICDIFFVARLGANAVATVGLTESMLTIYYALAIGLAMSTTALVARRIGENEPKAAAAAGVQGIWLGLTVAIVSGVPCAIFAPELLELMKAEPAVVAGSSYTRILLGCNGVIMMLFLNNAIFRGAGDAAVAMRSLWLANAVNLVLDPCLIFGLGPFPELGLEGAAIATTIGRGTGVLYQARAFRRGHSRILLTREVLPIVPRAMLNLLRVSVGGISQYLIATASWVVLMRIVASFGSAAVAGYTIAIRILIFALLPSWGLSNAAATLVGQSLGARKPERAERSVWVTGVYNMIFLGLVMVLLLLFAQPLVELFHEAPAVTDVGVHGLRVISYGYLFYAWGMVLVQAFNGAGDTMTPTWINLACFWMLQIPLAWLLALELGVGPGGVFWSVAVSESVVALVAVFVFRRGRWKLRQV